LAAHFSWRRYGFRLFAIGGICTLALATVAHLYIFDAAEQATSRSARYDLGWTGVNGRVEFALFHSQVARFAALGAQKDADSAKLFYDILRSRMQTWHSGVFRQFIERSPARSGQYQILQARLEDVGRDIGRLSEPDARLRILQKLEDVGPIVERIGSDAYNASVAEAAAIRELLSHQQQRQRLLVLALLASGAAVLVFTAMQNRSLRAAHVTAARHAEDSLFLARHDSLTKLPNRPTFEAAYDAALQAKGDGERIVIAAIDLDGFKAVNDLLGHAAGDALLVAISDLLAREAARADSRNMICRAGGDEFLALLWMSAKEGSVPEFCDQVLAKLERPLETTYGAIMVGASFGLAVSDGAPASDLIVNADLALAEAKARGKGVALAFEPGMLAGLKRRRRLEAEIGPAVDRGEFVPYYQPKVDVASQRLVAVEALARWHHSELGWISPAEFIPVSESNGAIVKLGRRMLEMACQDAAAMPADISVAVNISVVQILRDDIVDVVTSVLAGTGLRPERLTLEITESVMMSDTDKVLSTMKQFKALGVRISLDDFGTGYSALAYLTRFDWDELKIDRSFICRAWSDPINLTIIKAVRLLARQMNAKLTIEGVETAEQHDLLREIGCDMAQGYLFGKPAPLGELQGTFLRQLAAAGAERDAPLNRQASGRAPSS
jgi:diguanylate cyclase (GGDEF)-like protein